MTSAPVESSSVPTSPLQVSHAGGSRFGETLKHARYVVTENPVTGFAFALFVIIVGAAIFGPAVAPYDPYASDTAAALQSPSAAHWFGTDQVGRDVFSRVLVATRLDLTIAVASVALVFAIGGLAGDGGLEIDQPFSVSI
jgi:peptide/nickel transport system permease protein